MPIIKEILKAGLKKSMATRVDKVTKTIKGPKSPQATINKDNKVIRRAKKSERRKQKEIKEGGLFTTKQSIKLEDKLNHSEVMRLKDILSKSKDTLEQNKLKTRIKELENKLPFMLKPQAMSVGTLTGAGLNNKDK